MEEEKDLVRWIEATVLIFFLVFLSCLQENLYWKMVAFYSIQ